MVGTMAVRAVSSSSSSSSMLARVLKLIVLVTAAFGLAAGQKDAFALDLGAKTIGGTLNGDQSVVVPPGLYYAESSIVLDGESTTTLVLQAGTRIMFAPTASFEVKSGVLTIQGTAAEPVELLSTDQAADEYGDETIDSSDNWGGLVFRSLNQPTYLNVNDEYVSGSKVVHCKIVNGGTTSRAAIYMDSTSVLLQNVDVISAKGIGVHAYDPILDVLFKDVTVSKAGSDGVYVQSATIGFKAVGMNITESGRYGLYMYSHVKTIISDSYFARNRNNQIYTRYGQGSFNLTEVEIVGPGSGSHDVAVSTLSTTSPGQSMFLENVHVRDMPRGFSYLGSRRPSDSVEIRSRYLL